MSSLINHVVYMYMCIKFVKLNNQLKAGSVHERCKFTLELDLLVFIVDKHTESAVPLLATEVWPALCQQLHHQAG